MTAAMELMPEFNEWMQLVPMPPSFRNRLCLAMLVDLGGCWLIEQCSYQLFFKRKQTSRNFKSKSE